MNRVPSSFGQSFASSPCACILAVLIAACLCMTPGTSSAEGAPEPVAEQSPAVTETDCDDASDHPCKPNKPPPRDFQRPLLRGEFGEMTGNPMARFGFGHCHELENGELFCH